MMRRVIMTPQAHNKRRRFAFIAVGCIVAIALLVIMTSLVQKITDYYTFAHADPAMVLLANRAGMNRAGELVFLRTHPQLVSDTEMQRACADNTSANNSDGFIEQGCYVTNTHHIYLRRMPSNLYKLEVSTAAYEMLHPIYIGVIRSNSAATVNRAIEENYTRLKNPDLAAQVANFAKTEPGARDLELFSLLGTGYTNISSNLTRYYKPYFTNLGATVLANNQITQLFHQSQNQLAQLKAQAASYDSLAKNAYAASVMRAHAGDQSGDEYYYGTYQRYLGQENAAITQYDTLLESYNALVTEYNGTQPVSKIGQAQTQSQ